jgi:hypothetical protein
MRISINTDQMNYKINDKTWKMKISKWKEESTTSPSEVHLRHYKAPYKPHNYTYEDNTEHKSKMDVRQSKIKELQNHLLNLIIENQVILP